MPETVQDYLEILKQYPLGYRVMVATHAGGGISIEHRQVDGEDVIAIFGSNGGRFGENPLTEVEYRIKSGNFLSGIKEGQLYTQIHGDDRLYNPGHDTVYGTHYDKRVVDRLVSEGLFKRPKR
jgi:hypothetical protein